MLLLATSAQTQTSALPHFVKLHPPPLVLEQALLPCPWDVSLVLTMQVSERSSRAISSSLLAWSPSHSRPSLAVALPSAWPLTGGLAWG